jgi:hypothetical protein
MRPESSLSGRIIFTTLLYHIGGAKVLINRIFAPCDATSTTVHPANQPGNPSHDCPRLDIWQVEPLVVERNHYPDEWYSAYMPYSKAAGTISVGLRYILKSMHCTTF